MSSDTHFSKLTGKDQSKLVQTGTNRSSVLTSLTLSEIPSKLCSTMHHCKGSLQGFEEQHITQCTMSHFTLQCDLDTMSHMLSATQYICLTLIVVEVGSWVGLLGHIWTN
jgi:hypothetical protein